MESIITYGIIYLLVFRLAVLLLGGLCIFYGCRLFLVRSQKKGGGTDDQGIFFSDFGAIIVIAVLAGNQPDVKYSCSTTN